jgi:hypothetical protein
MSEKISENVAPALASAGLAKKPVRNRSINSPAKLSVTAVGKESAKKSRNVTI